MSKNSTLKELKNEIDEILILAKEGVLKGEKASKLLSKLRNPVLLDLFSDEILKLKYEKLQNKIDTLWRDRHGYTGGGIYLKRLEVIELELVESNEDLGQKYFGIGDEKNIINYLKSLFPNAKNSIIIYDNYFDIKLLRILSEINNDVKIKILMKEKSNSKLIKQIEAFEILYGIKIELKFFENGAQPSHDRYYIIDNLDVYSLGTSLSGKKTRATIFTPINKDEGVKIITDVNKWLK